MIILTNHDLILILEGELVISSLNKFFSGVGEHMSYVKFWHILFIYILSQVISGMN